VLNAKTFADFGIQLPHHASGEIDVTCPQCSPARKKKTARCLSVNVTEGVWTCHHCGWAGTLKQGARAVDVAWRKPQYRKPDPPKPLADNPTSSFLIERGIPADVIERNRISVTRVYMPQAEDHVRAIAFPYFRGDELVNVKYRDRDKNFRMETGAERVLYGLNDIDPESCIVVEGEIDKLSVEAAGFVSCVSVPDGAPSESAKDYASKFSFLEADQEQLERVKQWIIAVDSDKPGKRLEDELARRLGREKCKRVTWPSECKDANDVLRSFGADVLRECIEHAEPFPIAGVFDVTDLSSRIDHLYEHGWERGVSTGWDEIDRLYTVRPGEFSVITGIPNSGKSNWLDALLINIARDHGWRFAVFSPENQPLEDHMARMIEKWARAPFSEGPTLRMDRESLRLGKQWLGEHFTWILPDDDSDWTIDTVLDRAKALVFRKGIRGFVIDPWNELEHALPPGVTETIYTGSVLRRARQFARRHGVHVWIVAHPQKLYRDKDTGNYPVPTLYDISGSAHWRNKADNGIVVWRDFGEQHNPVEIHVQKIRFRQIGRIGLAKLAYEPSTQTYRELGFEHPQNLRGSASRRRREKAGEAQA
jgi:twinkle protein